jgi:hypothetical protein
MLFLASQEYQDGHNGETIAKLRIGGSVMWGSSRKTVSLFVILSCLICFLGGCGGMSAGDIEKIVRKDSGSFAPYVASRVGIVTGGSVSFSDVKVEAIFKKSSAIPNEWRDPSHNFAAVEQLANYQKEKLCFAVVSVQGTCQGDVPSGGPGLLTKASANFKGKVLYAVTPTKAIPFPVWQASD